MTEQNSKAENNSTKDCAMTVPFFKPSLGQEEKEAACAVIDSGWLTTGNVTFEFEKEFAAFLGCSHALAVNSNTSGMILALEACGVGPGKAVITTPYTFVSTAATAVHLGADVYFADVEEQSNNIDPGKIEEILKNDTEHTVRAIIPVHIAGNLCNMQKIVSLAKKYSTADNKIYVIEDAAHAFPCKTENGYAGTLGDAGIFSFYATKTMTTGEGGMVCTNSDELAKRMTVMRLHGMDRSAWDRYTSPRASWEYDIIEPGFKFNLPDVLSAIGRVQLKKALLFDSQRKEVVKQYNKAFGGKDFLHLPPDSPSNCWHLYIINLNLEKLDCDRDTFAKELQAKGLGISMHFIPLFHFTWWKNKYPDFTPSRFVHAENHYKSAVSLPLWPGMDNTMIEYVIKTVLETGEKHHVR